jgi:uncharacterized protein YkwD
MKNLLLFACIVFVSAIVFSPVSATAQKTKPVDPKSIATKTETRKPAAKPTVQNSNQTPVPMTFEQEILNEINTARTNPQKYIQYLEDYKKLFKGNIAYFPNSVMLATNEGTAAVDDAINYLKSLPLLKPYIFSTGLNKVVGLHMKDLVENPTLSHKSKDGSDLYTRLTRVGSVDGNYAENITFKAETARAVVLTMLIDDGVKSRGHRKNILSPTHKVVGIAFAKGKPGDNLCIVNFTEGFSDGAAKPQGVIQIN